MKNFIVVWTLLFYQQVLDVSVKDIQNAVEAALPELQAAAYCSTILKNGSDLLFAKRNRGKSHKNG
jgi:hypothetical protein